MTEGNIQYNQINIISLRGWRRYCNPLKYRCLGTGSSSFDDG